MVFVNVYGETFEDIDRNRRLEHNDEVMKTVIREVNCFEKSFININSELIAVQNRLEDVVEYDFVKLKNFARSINKAIEEYERVKK